MMKKIGVVEGFFGPQWKMNDRMSFASFLSKHGGDFYIYAPKQDSHLRKLWRLPWASDYQKFLEGLVLNFHQAGVKFGMGLSPFGLGPELSQEDKAHLIEKLEIINKLKIDLLGLFFDDMPSNANLAATQIAVLNFVKKTFKGQIIFCPSYYTFDPILDKVFGARPPDYLARIAQGVSLDMSIAWTGPKVISPVIDQKHLAEVKSLLKRKPFIWENFFANDGPKNCKFLKLKPFIGRDKSTFEGTEAFGLNLMNQAQLSKILFLASKYVLDGNNSEDSFKKAITELCSPEFREFLFMHRDLFLTVGLDNIDSAEKISFIKQLKNMDDPAAFEVQEWLQGKYLVDSDCLTD